MAGPFILGTDLEAGRYLCIKTNGFVPWVIREATRSEVDHTAIVLPDGRVAEAEPGGVIISPLAKYRNCYAVANTGERMWSSQLEASWQKAESLVGTEYNFAAIGDDAAAALGWHWALLLHFTAADHRLDCSQMGAVCGEAAGLDWLCGKSTYCEVTPADLARRPGVERVTIT